MPDKYLFSTSAAGLLRVYILPSRTQHSLVLLLGRLGIRSGERGGGLIQFPLSTSETRGRVRFFLPSFPLFLQAKLSKHPQNEPPTLAAIVACTSLDMSKTCLLTSHAAMEPQKSTAVRDDLVVREDVQAGS